MQYIDDVISRRTIKKARMYESQDSSASALLLLLLEVGNGDKVILVFPVDFQNSPWDKEQKDIYPQELQP